MSNNKKILGATKKSEREKAKTLLLELAGKAIATLSKAETERLLTALCLLFGVADVNGIIK